MANTERDKARIGEVSISSPLSSSTLQYSTILRRVFQLH
jgi:hypothetical protein